jgi:hypothetical protein
MVGYLLAVDLCSIGVGALQSFSNDWIELHKLGITGFKNMVM